MQAPDIPSNDAARLQAQYPAVAAQFVIVTGGATTSSATLSLAQLPNDVVEKSFSLAGLLSLERRDVLRRSAT